MEYINNDTILEAGLCTASLVWQTNTRRTIRGTVGRLQGGGYGTLAPFTYQYMETAGTAVRVRVRAGYNHRYVISYVFSP